MFKKFYVVTATSVFILMKILVTFVEGATIRIAGDSRI